MTVFYNEIDPFAAAWLRELAGAGRIPAGIIDERSIEDVESKDLEAFGECHFFAGIGGWPLALELAGWPPGVPVWTGSCPCQPFSVAGKAGGVGDERHLWPALHRLIAERRPAVVFGEQVASADGRLWLSGVRTDLERLGYAVGAADLCAAGQGAPHIRQRLYWVADATDADWWARERQAQERTRQDEVGRRGSSSRRADGLGRLGDSCGTGLQAPEPQELLGEGRRHEGGAAPESGPSPVGRVEHATGDGRVERRAQPGGRSVTGGRGAGFWSDARIIECTDGKRRRIPAEPALFPLASGLPRRVGLLRGSGNAIVPQVAAAFVTAWREARLGLGGAA